MQTTTSPKRFLTYFSLGIIAESVRLLIFRLLQNESAVLANVISIPFGILVTFALYTTLVWPDRPGANSKKLARFGISKGITWLIKCALFPAWVTSFPCPLYELTHSILDGIGPSFLGTTVTCEWMSVALMDFCLALTLGFYLHNNLSFSKGRISGPSHRRLELKRILDGFGLAGLVILCLLGIYFFGAWGAIIGSISGFILGTLVGAFYVAIARTGLYG